MVRLRHSSHSHPAPSRVTRGRVVAASGLLLAAVAATGVVGATPQAVAEQPPGSVSCSSPGWVRAWSSNMGGQQRFVQEDNAGGGWFDFEAYPLKPARALGNQTLRMIAAPKFAGEKIRITLSNKFGTFPQTFRAVHVGIKGEGASISGPNLPVTFDGRTSVTAGGGQEVVSDPIALPIRPFQKVAISFHVPNLLDLFPTHHMDANRTSYLTPKWSGNFAATSSGARFTEKTTSNYFAAAIDTLAPAGTVHVSAFGDSFTEPITTTVDAEHRPADFLTRRLLRTPGGDKVSVTMGSLSFNFVTDGPAARFFGPEVTGWGGRPATTRIVEDALDVPGTTAVFLVHGLNDLAFGTSAERVIQAYREIVAAAHARGIKVIAGTLNPTGGATGIAFLYGLDSTQAKRNAVNDYIRTSGLFDGVVDLDEAVRDPQNPNWWAPGLSPDQIHPGDQGARVEADAVDLDDFLAQVACQG